MARRYGCTECGLVCTEGDIKAFDTHDPHNIPDLHWCLGCGKKTLKVGHEPPADKRHAFRP